MSFLLLAEVSEQTTALVRWLSLGAVAATLILFAVICLAKRKKDTRRLVFNALCLALSFVLSLVKFAPVTFGGSITLASMVPVLLSAWCYGAADGLIVGTLYGLLSFVQSPYILTPATFLLDYLVAFSGVALTGVFKKAVKNRLGALALGVSAAYLWRFAAHLVSGVIYFGMGAVFTDLPQTSAFLYSFLYQSVYLVPDYLICLFVMLILEKKNVISRLSERLRG